MPQKTITKADLFDALRIANHRRRLLRRQAVNACRDYKANLETPRIIRDALRTAYYKRAREAFTAQEEFEHILQIILGPEDTAQ
jgi:hypothetical protein